uniref:Uncharacterized protein n=1 Tax=Rheinheimera sp. BAL341 TaxID=1708203 RepID=A0A486XS84_9GAMM
MNTSANNLHLYADPDAIRLFWGYKKDNVTQDQFNKDLGETFMPGTPAVLAPMGLNGYLPAVLNLDQPEKYPDEVALIVYPSLPLYNAAREDNLLGRIYTYSHLGVFDMDRSRGQWPGTTNSPEKHSVLDRWAWRVLNHRLDWQKGQARLFALESHEVNVYETLLEYSKKAKSALGILGVEEMIVQSTAEFATIWLYSVKSELEFDFKSLGFPNELRVISDLRSEPFNMRRGNETLEVKDAVFIQFRFPREVKYYL